jgi:hypothetical protein
MQVFDDRFEAESDSVWKLPSKRSSKQNLDVSILTLLGSGHHNLHETYQCRMYSRKLLRMGREDARNM